MTNNEIISTIFDWNVVVTDEDKPIRITRLIGKHKETRKVIVSSALIYFERNGSIDLAQDKSGVSYLLQGEPAYPDRETIDVFNEMQRHSKNQLYFRYLGLPNFLSEK